MGQAVNLLHLMAEFVSAIIGLGAAEVKVRSGLRQTEGSVQEF